MAEDVDFDAWKSSLTVTQRAFVAWNAARLEISTEETAARYFRSWRAWPGGHSGPAFRDLGTRMHRTYEVFSGDGPAEVFDAYRLHSPMHFLRMLAYPDPTIAGDHPVVRALDARERGRRDAVAILDFGCGLAQFSRALARHLAGNGVAVRLALADIPTIRKDFLLWVGRRDGIPTTFLDCTAERPVPALPDCDLCVATEVFEHFHRPLDYLDAFENALRPGGLLLTNVDDHAAEPFHVSPDLSAVRGRLVAGFHAAVANRLYVKH